MFPMPRRPIRASLAALRRPVLSVFLLPAALLYILLLPGPLLADVCEPSSPALPVPAFLWPATLEPAQPGQSLPPRRDSTQYQSFGYPGFQDGHELYSGVDVLDGYLFAAYNAGLQVWDVDGPNAADPELLVVRDGWVGSFQSFQSQPTEIHFYIDDVVALRESPTTILVAASGRLPRAGVSLWRFDTETRAFDALYQDPGSESYQVRLVKLRGRILLIVARPDGVFVFDATRAAALGRCLEDPVTGLEECPGVFLGRLGTSSSSLLVDALVIGDRLFVSSTDGTHGSPTAVELWRLDDPSDPGSAVRLANGLSSKGNGTALFEHAGHLYLAAVHGQGAQNRLGIHAIDACLTGPCSFGPEVAGKALLPFSSQQYLSFSRSHGDPFLYYGGLFSQMGGESVEMLLDLRPLRPDHTGIDLPELGSGGPTYTDACTGVEVGYWGWYYPRNESGLRNVAPRKGKFHGDYFYRAAVGVLDVHRRTGVESAPAIFLDGFETGSPGRWSASSP